MYEVLKLRLKTNMKRAKELVLLESEKILKQYSNIEFYLNNIAYGRIAELRKDNKRRRYKTVDHLREKQRVVKILPLSL